jgi:hypothetical protein
MMNVADGFRTDTARTILSAPEGDVAGHSGSDLSTEGQAAAHNLLRATMMEILQLDPAKNEGITEKAIAVLFGSVTVTSMAPGEMARQVKGGADDLKSKRARDDWEPARNEAKARVDALFTGLSADEQAFVKKYADKFLESTQEGVTVGKRRLLRANSPPRGEDKKKGQPSGVEYKKGVTDYDDPMLDPPAKTTAFGPYITQRFRDKRQ